MTLALGHPGKQYIADALQAALAGDGLSLMLPSGRILGHRSLKVYYNQRLAGDSVGSAARSRVNDKVIAVRQRLADPSQALISIAGGHGAYGKGLEVMRATNAGEASWAKKQARSHLDQKRREAFRTAVGYKHNNQKRECMSAFIGPFRCLFKQISAILFVSFNQVNGQH